ncbi:MAG: inorganic phosphate transporter [Promethearchaeia archaeon]
MDLSLIIIIFLILSILIAFAIGANDETFATVYGSRTLTMKQILILTTIFAISGAFILGEGVSKTVGKGILKTDVTNAIVITILISTAIWLIISSTYGLPISTTHATIGAILGLGLLFGGAGGLKWGTIFEMTIWWLLSPLIGYIATYVTYKLVHKTVINKLNGLNDFEKTEKRFSYLLLVVICITAFSRAGNDCSNAVGILTGVESIDINLALFLVGISFALGIIVLGRIVIQNVGAITELRPSTAFAAEIPTTIILFVGTALGIPLSGSHMLVASLVGLSKASRSPTQKGLWKIVLVWLLTFPAAGLFSIIIYFPIESVIA